MRVRIKLDEARLTELIQGMDASAVPGLLRHLGDVASLSFAPYQNGDSPILINWLIFKGTAYFSG